MSEVIIMDSLTNDEIIEVYIQAVALKLEPEFIALLEKEIVRRKNVTNIRFFLSLNKNNSFIMYSKNKYLPHRNRSSCHKKIKKRRSDWCR